MSAGEGFTDLRLNRQEGQTEESFWPSFTDIMTVIVMIFLLAMVILLVRNMDLVQQLRATMKAEREAAALAQSTGAEKDSLRLQLQASERQVAQLREQILHMAGQGEQQEAAIASQQHQIDALLGERDRLSEALRGQQERGDRLGEELVQARTAIDEGNRRLAEYERDLETTRGALEAADRRHTAQVTDLEAARVALDAERRRLGEAQNDLTSTRADLDKDRGRLAESLKALDAARAALAEANALADGRADELAETRRSLEGVDGERRRVEALLEQRVRELAEARGALATLEATHAELGARQARIEQEVDALLARQKEQEVDLKRREADSEALARELDQARAGETAALTELEELRLRYRIQEQALTQALARIQAADLDLSELKETYGDLRIKYDELVKPARTAEGRFVVEIRYYKAQGNLKIELREPGGGFAPIARERLEARLAEMKKQHPEGLYVRVIFPDDSGLSYKEAWGFTTELHRKFDYYYQDRQGAALPAPEVEPPTGPIAQ